MATKTAKEKELMNTKMKMRTLSLLLCFVMLVGLVPTTVFAAGTKLETPQNLNLQGTVLSWDAVDNADYYSVHLYYQNYQYNIGIWQTDGTSFNLYKYLKDGETYGATVIACSNGSYQISTPAEIPLTACTNAGVPIYRDVNVVNGTSSNTTAYPGMSVRLEAKPAPAGMVFDRWELSGGYINIGYSDTDTTIYVQAICDNDISARATYKYQENVTSAFTVQPQGGAALVGKSFDVTYAMNFTPQGTVKVQVEGNTPGVFTDLKQGEIDSASIKEDSVVTKTFRIMAFDGTRNIYSDEFVVSWEDGPRFISQPMGGTVDHNVDFVATYALNFTPFSCRVERYSDYLYQWVDLSNASATEATIDSYDFNTSSNYRIKAIIEGGGEVYSDEFTVTWSDAVSKFIQQPVGGTVGFDEEFTFTFAINFTPASNIAIQKYNSGFDSWDTVGYCASLTSGTISGFASETTNKYRLEAYENGTPIYSNEFTVTWEGTDYTVSFAANGGSGTMADVNNVSGEYTLPACEFTAPNGQRFKAWLVGGNEKAVGDKITVSANTVVTAVWENIPEYIVSYNANGGSGTMVGDMVEENGKFTLENCTYIAPEGYKFKAWAIGSVNGEQKQPGEQITITGETYIYAIWEAVEYNVTVTGGTASVGAGTPITKATMGTTVTLTADPAPFGKMFDKWVVTGVVVADANSATTTFVMPAGNVTAEATYKDIPVVTYTVNFDANGGTGSMADATGVSGEYVLPICSFTAPSDKQFKAWSVGGAEKAAGDTITVNANTTVTAIWEDIPVTYYTVTFDSAGGSTVTAQTIEAGQKATKPADPTKDGFDFKGWTLNGSAYDFNTAVNGNITLVATWEQQQVQPTVYTVTFDSNGGSAVTAQSIEAGQKATKPADPTKDGYDFKGWTLNGSAYDFNTAVNGNITLVATWEQQQVVPTTYTVSFAANGGTGTMADVTGISGEYTLPENGFTAPDGKQFKAWSVDGNEKAVGDKITVTANTTVTAIWEAIEYTVTVSGSYASASGAGEYAVGETVNIYAGTKSGYTFNGWTSDDVTVLSASSKNASFVMPDKNVTVKANWTYNGGGGGGGGYTYYTIKATAGVNGSISPTGSVSVREGRDQIFTITPDKGYAVSNVKIDGKSIGAVRSYTFENVRRTHTIEVIFMKANGNPQTGVFVDVATGSYYEDAVDWAVENGITKGTDDTLFSPDGICTRAQAVTFLWRAAGSPAAKSSTMPFTDVKAGSYYYDAVLWAVENGITKGTSDTMFSPDANCSRAQIVTFLWRSQKSPAAGTANPFADVKSTAYYADAVLWAVKEDITKGTTNTTFSPDADCTRAQIVTFLWRALAE